MKQVIKHKDVGLLNIIRRTESMNRDTRMDSDKSDDG